MYNDNLWCAYYVLLHSTISSISFKSIFQNSQEFFITPQVKSATLDSTIPLRAGRNCWIVVSLNTRCVSTILVLGFSVTSTMDLGIIKWRKKIEVASQTNKKIYSVLVLGRSFALAVILRQNTRLNEPFINYWWLFPMTAEYRTPNALFRVP